MPKIIFFTAGGVPTTPEQTEINQIAAFAADPYEFQIRDASKEDPDKPEDCDYKAGSAPSSYDEVTAFDVDAPPELAVGADQIVLTDGETTDVEPTGSYTDTVTFTIVDGAITAITLS